MEEITPTMPCVMYLKYLKITGYSFDSQGKFEYAVCLESCKIKCDTMRAQKKVLFRIRGGIVNSPKSIPTTP